MQPDMRALLDTCVVIDTLQDRKPFADGGQAIFLAAANRQFDGFITAKSVTDIYYITHRFTHSDRDTRHILHKLFSLFELLDTAAMDCRNALASNTADFEDAVMIESAVRCKLDCIVTRNIRDYTQSPIPVHTPSDFLKQLFPLDEEE